MLFFTADEHFDHEKAIEYCNRPFSSVAEMNEEIIKRHNEVVRKGDFVIHGGDFTLRKDAQPFIRRLHGEHLFLKGSHDRWMETQYIKPQTVWERMVDKQYVVVCHYAMRVWPRSHYGSWMLYGHSHGKLPPLGKQHDIGVDNNNFYPVSFEQVVEIMKTRDDNPNLLKKLRTQ